MSRTTRRFQTGEAPFDIVERWAAASGFRLRHADDVRRLYRRGFGIPAAPIYVQVIYTRPWAHLQAWIGVNIFVRFGALLIAPGEMALETAGWRLARSRRIAREAVNRLLRELGQDEIE